MDFFNYSLSLLNSFYGYSMLVINLISVSDTTTHEIKWEGTFNAISGDIKVEYMQHSAQMHAYIDIHSQLLSPFLLENDFENRDAFCGSKSEL